MQTDNGFDELNFTLLHVGINSATPEEARQLADLYCTMLGKKRHEGEASYFSGSVIEVMKQPYLGTHGHMAYGVSDMTRALQSLEARGFYPDMDTAGYNADGHLTVVYLQGEFGGFAVHLKLI